jgi:DNA gyrase inhibitor GyrI
MFLAGSADGAPCMSPIPALQSTRWIPVTLVLAVAVSAGCAARPEAQLVQEPDVALTVDPGHAVHADWKERLEEPYLYLEHVGDYRDLGARMLELFERVDRARIEPSGPPFALYFDDPGRVPLDELRSRACVPVGRALRAPEGLGYDVLPRATVAYAVVAGAYAEVPRALPGIFRYLSERGWTAHGPVREVYLNAADARETAELRTELQVPWTFGGR